MTVAIAGKNVSLGALIAGLGGLVAIVAALLAWYSFSVSTSGSMAGQDLTGKISVEASGLGSIAGIIVLLLGIAVVALAVAWIQAMNVPNLQLIIAAAGVVILVLLALTYFVDIFKFDFKVNTEGIYKSFGGTIGVAGSEYPHKAMSEWDSQVATLRGQTSSAGISLSTSGGAALGFFLEIGAGVLAIVGGLLGMQKKAA